MLKHLIFFLLAGAIHTSLDFGVYNLLTREPAKLSRIQANCVSTTIAMAVSFTANLVFVFHPKHVHGWERGLKFVAITAFSSYVLQSAVIYFTSFVWLVPVRSAKWLSGLLFPTEWGLGNDFVPKNTVKALAVLAGLVWNFLWYRYFVFVE